MKRCILVFTLILFTIPLLTCTDLSDNVNFPLGKTGYALVLLNLGYPDAVATAQPTLVDRFFSLFTKTAHAQLAAPAFILSATVRVWGGDFGLIEQTFTGAPVTIISMQVPAGSMRIIEVTAYVSPTDPSAAVSFKGTTVMNLTGGEAVSVPIVMGLNRTKLIIPDAWNDRLVKVDNMTGANWLERGGADYSPVIGSFRPYDVDFDNRGRVYIVNSLGTPGVMRINNMTTNSYVALTNAAGITAIAVDRNLNRVYYNSSATAVTYTGLEGQSPQVITFIGGGIESITGLAVDEEGSLYVTSSQTSQMVLKYRQTNATTFNLVTSYTGGILQQPRDVIVKSPYVYVANQNGASGFRLVQFDKNLQLVRGYGSAASPPSNRNPGMFYGPYRFVAVVNDEITIEDEDNLNSVRKLISMLDGGGLGWSTYGTYGTGVHQFYFYSC